VDGLSRQPTYDGRDEGMRAPGLTCNIIGGVPYAWTGVDVFKYYVTYPYNKVGVTVPSTGAAHTC
jgi:hypothetical protein